MGRIFINLLVGPDTIPKVHEFKIKTKKKVLGPLSSIPGFLYDA